MLTENCPYRRFRGEIQPQCGRARIKKFEAKGFVLEVGQKPASEVAMQVGAASTEVTVEGSAIAQVETQSSSVRARLRKRKSAAAAQTGEFHATGALVPGVSNQTGQDEAWWCSGQRRVYASNGAARSTTTGKLDAATTWTTAQYHAECLSQLDSIAEFKVLTSNYGAQ